MNTPDARRRGMRLTAVALALTLLGGFAVADGFAAPAAESAVTDPAGPLNFYPSKSGGTGPTSALGANPCPGLEKSNKALFDKFNCTAKVIGTLTVPSELVPEYKLGNIMGNCSPTVGATLDVGSSEVRYVEEGLTTSESRSQAVTEGLSVSKEFSWFFAGMTVTASITNMNGWENGTAISKSIQEGQWVNNNQSIPLPPYSWGYFAFRTQMRQADVLWQWTPDPKNPNKISTDVQTLTTRDVRADSTGTSNGNNAFGTVAPKIIPMSPAEVRACWERSRPAGWKEAGDPILDYTPSSGVLPNPVVEEPAMLAPVNTVPLDSYPFIYSVSPISNPITRNIERAERLPFNGPKSQANFVKPDGVQFWELKNGQWGRATTKSSIVMPPGSEVGFWTGNACNRMTAQIGGSATTNRDYEQRVKVYSVSMVNGEPKKGGVLGDFVVPNPGKAAGNSASGIVDVAIPKNTEAIAIQTYRTDKKVQEMDGSWVFSGSRDTVVISNAKIICDPPNEQSTTFIRSGYQGPIKNAFANLAPTPAQAKEDAYLQIRPNATPFLPYACNERPDYVGYACNGTPTTSNGIEYKNAIGLHASTSVTWGLTSPTCNAFQFAAAWDDAVAGNRDRKPVTVEVKVDKQVVQTVRMQPYAASNRLYELDQALTRGPHEITVTVTADDDPTNSAAHINIINPRLVCQVQDLTRTLSKLPAKGPAVDLVAVGDLTWSNEVNWYAKARRDENAAMGGGPLVMAGITYPRGIGVHSVSSIDVRIPRTDCSAFSADVGVLDSGISSSEPISGTVRFEVWSGNKLLASTGIVRYGEVPTLIQADVTGLQSITLKVLNGGDHPYMDHAAWGRPVLVCDSPVTAPDPETPSDPSTPENPPVTPQNVQVLAARAEWAGNSYAYRPATRGTNLDTGKRVSINGTTFDTAIAQVSQGSVQLTTLGQCSQFTATVGVDDYARAVNAGSLKFELWGDGVPITSTPVMYWHTPATTLSAVIPGVKSLELRITDGGDGINWDHGVWGNPTLTCDADADLKKREVEPSERFITEMAWRKAETSDFEIKRDLNMMGNGPVRIAEQEYLRGIGAHSWSVVRVPINTTCTSFTADIGIDDTAGNNGSVTFQVWGDSTMLYESPVLRGSMDKVHIEVPLSAVGELALTVTDAWDGHAWDHGSWGDPQVACME